MRHSRRNSKISVRVYDHVVPDWDSILTLGFTGLKKRAEEYRIELTEKQKSLTEDQIAYFDGIEIEYAAIIRLIKRFYDLSLTKNGARLRQKRNDR